MRHLIIPLVMLCCSVNTNAFAYGLAAVYSGSEQGHHKLYFFDGRHTQRWEANAQEKDKDYPSSISQSWPNLPNHLDAAVYTGEKHPSRPHKILFFKGQLYWQWDINTKKMDPDYPKLITMDWKGAPDHMDAAAYAPYEFSNRQNKLYFFKSNQYWRWDINSNKMDAGYPKKIADGWTGLPNASLDMVVYSGVGTDETSQKLYLFQGNRYWRWDLNNDQLDDGYTKTVHKNWPDLRY